jgi:predicted Zn-dependent protease
VEGLNGDALRATVPRTHLKSRVDVLETLMNLSLPIALVCLSLLAGCATQVNPVTGRSERSVMDEPTEIAEGKKAHTQVLEEYGVYQNPKLQAYVNDLGQRLAKHSHRSQLVWTFTVLDSPEINAFALPGGYVYVTRGIMAYMESEADLAGVIGHEIGHVTARHGAQRATKQQTAGLGVLAATILGAVLEVGGVGGATQAASGIAQNVAAGSIAKYGREQELQADGLGAEYLSRSNYDPKNMVDVIQVLKSQERFAEDAAKARGKATQAKDSWLSSHPSNDLRLQQIKDIAARYPGRYDDDGRARYLAAINGMPFGESREQGVTRGRNFYHEPLGIALTAPVGWQIQNSPEAIVVMNPERDAGVIVRVVPPDAGKSHDEIIRKLLQPVQGRTEAASFSGLPATHITGTRRTEQGQNVGFEATVVTGPENRNYLMLHAAKDAAALQRLSPQLRGASATFRPLTAADRSAAKPWSLNTVPYRAGSLPQLARQTPLGDSAEPQLRLLNGVYGGGEPKAGDLVKIVE